MISFFNIFFLRNSCQVQLTFRKLNHLMQLVSPFQLINEIQKILNICIFGKISNVSLPSTEIESLALLMTVPNYYQKTELPQSSFSDISQNKNSITEIKNSLHGSQGSLNDAMESQRASSNAPSTATKDSQNPQKTKTCESDSPKSQRNNYNILKEPAFLKSNVIPPILNSWHKADLHRDNSVTSQFSSEIFQFEAQLTLLCVVLTPYKIQLKPNRYIDHSNSHASKKLAPYEHWIPNFQKFLSLEMNFLSPSDFDLNTGDSKTSSQFFTGKRVHLVTYERFWDIISPISKKLSFFNFKCLNLHFHYIFWSTETFI